MMLASKAEDLRWREGRATIVPRGPVHQPSGSVVGDRREEAGIDAPLLEVAGGVELGDLADAVGHLHARAAEELVVIFLQEGRRRHLAPAPGDRALTAQEAGCD